jgi:flagellar protein FliO/FliZ
MFDLFGQEMPLAVRFFLAFLIVLGLIGAAAWAVRRFGSARLSGAVRGRQPRLAVIEYATVDARRRLLLVRRDNVEHLMMVGGPSDVVVEANIVRAAPATVRETTGPRVSVPADTLSRPLPLPEAGSNGSWPLQPEAPALSIAPAAPPRRAPRIEPLPEEPLGAPTPHAEPMLRPQREALNALADDLASVVPPAAPMTPPPRSRTSSPRLQATEPRMEAPRMETPRVEAPRFEATRMEAPRMEAPRVEAPRVEAPRIETPRAPAIDAGSADQSLAEMAQRLEAALRKPKAAESRSAVGSGDDDADLAEEPSLAPPLRSARPAETKPARAEAKPKESKALYDTLEQEMASLLGRPASKN